MRVLIIKTSSMGDILHTLPALTDAMRARPNIIFDWIVEEDFAQIPTWHLAVQQVIPIAIRRWRKNLFSTITWQEYSTFKHQLQKKSYDVIIDAQGLIKSAVLSTLVVQGEKHGFNCQSVREYFASYFYQKQHSVSKKRHAIERIRHLFAFSLGYQLPKTFGDYAITSHFASSIYSEDYLVFLHSTTCLDKHWPEEYWNKLIKLVTNVGYRIKLFWGNKNEQLRAQRLANISTAVQVLPMLSLTEVAKQLAGGRAIISVDTGLSHLAAALNRPNITLYGPTNPDLIGCYGLYQQALRADDGNMRSITVENVWHILQQMLLSTNK